MANDDAIRNIPIYKAAMNDDWDAVEHVFDIQPDKLYAYITNMCETPLHIAIGTNSSHLFVNKIIERTGDIHVHKLSTMSRGENTTLHYAAKVGKTIDVKLLVAKVPGIAQMVNEDGHTALRLAAQYGRLETLWYLLEVTKDEPREDL